jgi:hypothetical protein
MKGFKIACLDVLEEMNTVYSGMPLPLKQGSWL